MRGCGWIGGSTGAGCPWGVPRRALSRRRLVPMQHPGAQRAEAFVQAFLRRSTPRMSRQAREDQLQRKAVVLEYFARRKPKEKRKRSRGLSARQRRGLRLFDIKPEQQRCSPPLNSRPTPEPGGGGGGASPLRSLAPARQPPFPGLSPAKPGRTRRWRPSRVRRQGAAFPRQWGPGRGLAVGIQAETGFRPSLN